MKASAPASQEPHRLSVGLNALWLLPLTAWWAMRDAPGWAMMWAMAATEFVAIKLLTMAGYWGAPKRRIWSYLLLWPGLNASRFLTHTTTTAGRVGVSEPAFASFKLALGLAGIAWAVAHAETDSPMLVGWMGMLGIIFALHFGFFHLVSWGWRRAGVSAAPIMRAPIKATSLTEFWSVRWNIAFAETARRHLFRPLARRIGSAHAESVVFLVSGLIHETVISLPARGGWGLPTLYFIIQAVGAWIERSSAGKTAGLGSGGAGWFWTMLITAVPLPLLFPRPFVEGVMYPFFVFISSFLP